MQFVVLPPTVDIKDDNGMLLGSIHEHMDEFYFSPLAGYNFSEEEIISILRFLKKLNEGGII